jgi:ribonuclease BN (tRNA processing enzyme)
VQVKLIRIEHIFLTRLTLDATGGLVGLFLTLSDMGTQEYPLRIVLHGPPGLQYLEEVFVRILGRNRNLFITYDSIGADGSLTLPEELRKEACDITPILLYAEKEEYEEEEEEEEEVDAQETEALRLFATTGEADGDDEQPAAKRARRGSASQSDEDAPLPPPYEEEHDCTAAASYLCKLTPTTGKFDLVSVELLVEAG